MSFYQDMQDVATGILDEFQQGDVKLVKVTPGSGGDPWNPASPSTAEYGLKAAVKGVSQKYVDGTLVVESDFQLTCAVPNVAPALTDKIKVDGAEKQIIRVIPTPAAGAPVVYTIIFR